METLTMVPYISFTAPTAQTIGFEKGVEIGALANTLMFVSSAI